MSIDNAEFLPVFSGPVTETALVGIGMPFATLSVGGDAGTDLTLAITSGGGKLYADPAAGATVTGGGSSALWIAGTIAQMNAKLATLVYAGATLGTDTLVISLLDAGGHLAALTSIPIAVVAPDASAPATIEVSGGTLTLDAQELTSATLAVTQPGGGLPTASLVLIDSTLGTGSRLDVSNAVADAARGARIAIAGRVEMAGTIEFGAGPATATLALGAWLTNDGQIEFHDSSAELSGGGTLRNNGTISVSGGHPALGSAIVGSGSIALADDSALSLAAVERGQTIRLAGGDTLILTAPTSMWGTLAGFAPGDTIVLPGVAADATSYQAIDAGHGVLTVFDGAATVATLDLAGPAPGRLVLSPSQGGATRIDGVALPAAAALTATQNTVDVYRFFDTTSGTEFLTQDLAERNAVAVGRPDLVYEGVAMQALDPAAAGATNVAAVFRFFDTVHGTHFFTGSATERDTLLATRLDLRFEPNSTLYEHDDQQAGDRPVFRFFDTALGTHFYTADLAERAHVLAARPDLTDEGIAFYARTR